MIDMVRASGRHADRRPALLARARMMQAWRSFFAAEDFLEIETPILQRSPGNETHISALGTTLTSPDGGLTPLYLHTSPEFAMKTLLAAGETRIVQFARVFRDRDRSPLHAPEFSLLEWYRVGVPLAALVDDCRRLLALAAEAAGTKAFVWRGQTCDPFAPPEHLSVCEAFTRYAGIDLAATLDRDGGGDATALARYAAPLGLARPGDSWSDFFSKILTSAVEPHLGLGRATILERYPMPEAALARRCSDDARFAERFELYACGVELANAFHELTEPVEQRQRFEAAMTARTAIYGDAYPIDEAFLAALGSMPQASGIALGIDRLVCLAIGAPRIDDVMWSPVPGPAA